MKCLFNGQTAATAAHLNLIEENVNIFNNVKTDRVREPTSATMPSAVLTLCHLRGRPWRQHAANGRLVSLVSMCRAQHQLQRKGCSEMLHASRRV